MAIRVVKVIRLVIQAPNRSHSPVASLSIVVVAAAWPLCEWACRKRTTRLHHGRNEAVF